MGKIGIMGNAAGLFFASLIVMVLTYTKPNWFWNAPKMRRARQNLSETDAEKLAYGLCAAMMVFAVLVAIFDG